MSKSVIFHNFSIIIGIAFTILPALTPLTIWASSTVTMPPMKAYMEGVGDVAVAASFNEPDYPITPGLSISIEREYIDYGDIYPGESSAEETVRIDNTASSDVHITVEVQGSDTLSQTFYEQSLYVNDSIYDPEDIVCSIPAEGHETVTTQLLVPSFWCEPGSMEATIIFWAEVY